MAWREWALAAAATSMAAGIAEARAGGASAGDLDRLAAAYRRAARGHVAAGRSDGISIAVTRCGRTAHATAGLADRERRRAVTPATPFEIGSVSKAFTALLLAHALREGRAAIDDDVRRYLPGTYPDLQWADGKPVTLGELADTTSGLPDYLPDPAPIARLPADRQLVAASSLLARYSNADFLRDLHGVRLVGRPGTAARHSNVAAQLLGVVVARLYGQSFATVLADKVERPAGMRRVRPTATTAVGYTAPGKVAPPFDGESIRPAGGLRYSGIDMARFVERQAEARDPAVALSQERRFTEAPDRQITFTWVRSPVPRGGWRYRLSGGTFGSSSYVEFYPALRYGVAILANRGSGSAQDELQTVAETVFAEIGPALRACPAGRRQSRAAVPSRSAIARA